MCSLCFFVRKERCRKLRSGQIESKNSFNFFNNNNNNNKNNHDHDKRIALIHAYADEPYDRSSFHLAGNAYLVADVASFIALDAIDSLQSYNNNNNRDGTLDKEKVGRDYGKEAKHPLIGLVDHISVMPLTPSDATTATATTATATNNEEEEIRFQPNGTYIPSDSHGLSSVYIGKQLLQSEKNDIDVLYYGSAHPNQTPLATVRREQTKFFKSGGLMDDNNNNNKDNQNCIMEKVRNQCTVGSPPFFVENYNILLSKNVSRKKAMKLTKMIRARDGGIAGVEALTLPYSDGRFEVACNLLCPHEGNVDDIEHVLSQWVKQEQTEHQQILLEQTEDGGGGEETIRNRNYFVDDSYRVGTTSDQCMEVLNMLQSNHDGFDEKYDHTVRERFTSYFS